MQNLEYELRKCKECSCSRCNLNGTTGCYIEVAIKEIGRYEQAFDSMKTKEHESYIRSMKNAIDDLQERTIRNVK